VQLAKLQVGEESKDIRLIVSTVAELESLVPWLLECRSQDKSISVSNQHSCKEDSAE